MCHKCINIELKDREDYLETALNEMEAAVQEAAKIGQQKETAHFADWEAYGRGVASKLMAKMGYKAITQNPSEMGVADMYMARDLVVQSREWQITL